MEIRMSTVDVDNIDRYLFPLLKLIREYGDKVGKPTNDVIESMYRNSVMIAIKDESLFGFAIIEEFKDRLFIKDAYSKHPIASLKAFEEILNLANGRPIEALVEFNSRGLASVRRFRRYGFVADDIRLVRK